MTTRRETLKRLAVVAASGAAASSCSTPGGTTVAAVEAPFRVENDSIIIHAKVNGRATEFILDTGDAIGPAFNAGDAVASSLPVGAPLGISGAGGASSAYQTVATIDLGGVIFRNEPSAIDGALQGPSLLGLPFFLAKVDWLHFDFRRNVLSFAPKSTSNLKVAA